MDLGSGFLEISGLSVGYGTTRVLEGIELAVGKGEFVALLGASGCGKTTLLRAIAGFASPSAGQIRVEGRDMTSLPPDRRGMALVFQSYALWPHMTVSQTIGYGLKLRRVPREAIAQRVAEMEALLGLTGLSDRKPAQLSGGQRQRVALGRALAINPEILLLDEPLSNLDARIRLTVRYEIRALQQRLGITAIHVTHDREEAMVMADRIVILDAGRIAQVGTPEALYNRPASSFVAAFLGAENRLELAGRVEDQNIVLEAGPTNATAVPLAGRTLSSGRLEARFRPEAATLLAAGAETGDRVGFAGTVETLAYPGGHWRHSVRVGEALVLADSPEPFRPGDAVTVAVQPADLFLFPLRRDIARGNTDPAPEARPAAGTVSSLTRTHQETVQ